MSPPWKLRFFSVWTGQHLSLLGSRASQFAVVWWLARETGSATVLAVAGILAMGPDVLLKPVAGVCIDRWSRRRVMVLADGANALISLVMAWLFWIGAMEVWHVYVAAFLRSVGTAFHTPAMEASTALMVPEDQLSRASGFNQTMFGLRFMAGPALGALLIETVSFQGAMLADALTALPALITLVFVAIPRPQPPATPDHPEPSVWAGLREGVQFVMGWRGLGWLLAAYFVSHLAVVPALTMFPLLTTDHFGGDATDYSILEAALGAGLVIGGLLLTAWGGFRRRVFTFLLGMGCFGASCFLIAAAPGHLFWLAVVGSFCMGLANPFADGSFMAILYGAVPPRLQGRVLSLAFSACQASMPLGLAIAGPFVDSVGLMPLYWVSGALTVAAALLLLLVPSVRRIQEDGDALVERSGSTDLSD